MSVRAVWWVLALMLWQTAAAHAWLDHAAMTDAILADWARNDADARVYLDHPVAAETLEHFLSATRETLPAALTRFNDWARENDDACLPPPRAIRYDASAADLPLSFRRAIRVNLDVALPPLIYDPHRQYLGRKGFTAVRHVEMLAARSTDPHLIQALYTERFAIAAPHAQVRMRDAIATGAAQPEFGLDDFLYANSPSAFGPDYGFNTQPIGSVDSPAMSRVLFEITTAHESARLLQAMPRLRECYPVYRALLFSRLSRFAWTTHHYYWAGVFLGWSLHYVQNMADPFNAQLLDDSEESFGAARAAGFGDGRGMAALVAAHLRAQYAFDGLAEYFLSASDRRLRRYHAPLQHALIDPALDRTTAALDDGHTLRDDVSAHTAREFLHFQTLVMQTMSQRFMSDLVTRDGFLQVIDRRLVARLTDAQRTEFVNDTAIMLRWCGSCTRAWVRGAAGFPSGKPADTP